MTIVKQISLFDIQELFEMESSHQFDAIISTFDVQPLHYAMIHSAKRYSKLSAKRIFENIHIHHVAQSYEKAIQRTFLS